MDKMAGSKATTATQIAETPIMATVAGIEFLGLESFCIIYMDGSSSKPCSPTHFFFNLIFLELIKLWMIFSNSSRLL